MHNEKQRILIVYIHVKINELSEPNKKIVVQHEQ